MRTWIGYGAVLAIGLGLAGAVGVYWLGEYGVVREHYVANAAADTRFITSKVEDAFASIYQNIRTISLLPSVRNLDRHGANLSDEAKVTIQQIYNNLATKVDVSEVYILPVDFDPEKIDPVTGHHEAPIVAFDQLIAPNNQAAADGSPAAAADGTSAADDFLGYPDDAGIPQIEIHEYRRFKQQLAALQASVPTLDRIDGMKMPMVGSPEVITCDNRLFDKSHNDADRSGLLQLVPFYGPDGKLKGAVAAIMLSNAYRALLPGKDYALVNTAYGYATRPLADAEGASGQEAASAQWVAQGKPDPSLVYSETLRVATPDATGAWQVWSGRPNSRFDASAEAVSVRNSAIGSFVAIAILTAAALLVCFLQGRSMRAAAAASAELERRVTERTAEIGSLATAAEAASAHSLARVAETSALNEQLSSVVGAALAGDFSGRIALRLDDPNLNTLGQSVNELVATVDRSIAETGGVLAALARTDLTRRVGGSYAGALARLKDDTNSVADRLTEVVLQLRSASSSVRTATAEILSGTNDLSERTTQQAANLEQTTAAVGRLDETTAEIAQRADAVNTKAGAVAATAEETGKLMAMANAAMERISDSSARIAAIIGMIDDVAFQTNLLALNASVEAARAGEAGRGFAVVAVEVRRLAQSAAGASTEVKSVVAQAVSEVSGGHKLVAEASRSLGSMLEGLRDSSALMGGIARATREQSGTISEISAAVRRIDEMMRHNAALVEETSAAIGQTEGQANALDRLVDVFILTAPATAPLATRPPRAATRLAG